MRETDGVSYFTLATERRVRRAEGRASGPVEDYAEYVERTEQGRGAAVLSDTTAKVMDFDPWGNVKAEEASTRGVDLTWRVQRTFKNDTERWVLGQLETQKECSAAAGLSRCRTLERTHTLYGEVETETAGSDEGIPDTTIHVTYARDDFGNIEAITAEDAHGHRRVSRTTYDPEGLFPETQVNAEEQTTRVAFDAQLGVLTQRTDPNGVVTAWKHDGFGRLGLVVQSDGARTAVALSRTKDGGPNGDAWRVRQRSATTGGADDTVELDGLGRPIRWFWHGPGTPRDGGEPSRLMQQVEYDALGEHVARRSVAVSEGTPARDLRYDVFEHDALGREVRHTTPWNAVVKTEYDGLHTVVTEPGEHLTVTEQDPLGRTVSITDAALGLTRYAYGPFGTLYTVTDPGGAVTRTTRDAFGRVRQLDEPDRGTTFLSHDGFGELVSSTDALRRKVTFAYDGLGRTTSRLDEHNAERLTTRWTWDTAVHGIGKLHTLASPDGAKTYGYNDRGLLETITLAVQGERDSLQARLGYDAAGRIETLRYPTPPGAAPFIVAHDHDAHGHVHAVRDNATGHAYWRLTDVDQAGRYRTEVFGNDVLTERRYQADQQRLESILTRGNAGTVQELTYAYDERLDLKSRTDALQTQNVTEHFRHDPLHRLTCAYFSPVESASVPCAQRYDHDPNGNLTLKSDLGALSYDDPLHPHAVTGAGGERYGYDAVGNQITRPGGATVRFAPFDLPKEITRGTADTVSFAYDGDAQRIRKTTPEAETRYFGGLYERVIQAASGTTEHRYYVHSPERAVAVIARGGATPGTRYLHVDHLGSVDALTDERGAVVERRSYDPFGQRRNPVWGEPVPASFAHGTTLGFTGHEGDDDLGLVNAKGRIYDPGIGRFLTPDPIVAEPHFGQSWNPYTYVLNSPLAYVDPSGFAPDARDGATLADLPGGVGLHFTGPTHAGPPSSSPPGALPPGASPPGALPPGALPPGASPPRSPTSLPAQAESPREAAEVGATTSPFNVSTTGSASGYVPQPVTTAQLDGSQGGLVSTGQGALGLTWTGDKLNPVTLEGQLGRALLGTEEPIEPWTPPAAVALTRAGMHLIPGLNSALVLSDPNASPLQKVLAVSTDVISVVGVGVVVKVGRAGVAAARGVPRIVTYEVGTYDALKARSVVGDALDIHHVGQAHAMGKVVSGYSRANGPSIALPQGEHALISTLRGPVSLSPRDLLARDIWNLRQHTNAPNGALRKLIELNKEMYPGALAK